jgi:hypothetical protein
MKREILIRCTLLERLVKLQTYKQDWSVISGVTVDIREIFRIVPMAYEFFLLE